MDRRSRMPRSRAYTKNIIHENYFRCLLLDKSADSKETHIKWLLVLVFTVDTRGVVIAHVNEDLLALDKLSSARKSENESACLSI